MKLHDRCLGAGDPSGAFVTQADGDLDLSVGSIVVEVNGQTVRGLPFEHIVKRIQACGTPIRISFEPTDIRETVHKILNDLTDAKTTDDAEVDKSTEVERAISLMDSHYNNSEMEELYNEIKAMNTSILAMGPGAPFLTSMNR